MPRFRLLCTLPAVVTLNGERWTIKVRHYPKGKASIDADCGAKGGTIYGGRASMVDRALTNGFEVPAGTLRHKLMLALVASERAQEIPPGSQPVTYL